MGIDHMGIVRAAIVHAATAHMEIVHMGIVHAAIVRAPNMRVGNTCGANVRDGTIAPIVHIADRATTVRPARRATNAAARIVRGVRITAAKVRVSIGTTDATSSVRSGKIG